jgi:hypothetical protein
MTQPIDPYHQHVWSDLGDPDPFLQPPGVASSSPSACPSGLTPASAAPAPPPSAPDPKLRATLLSRAVAGRTPPAPTLQANATAIFAAVTSVLRTPSQLQAGLDAFAASSCPTFHTPSGDVRVPTPYRAGSGGGDWLPAPGSRDLADLLNASIALRMNGDTLHAVIVGKGTPQQIRDLTQKLIDMGHLSIDNRPADVRIRDMMDRYGIGLDGSAYVAQAFLSATGLTALQAHFASIPNESLFQLATRGFSRVAPSAAQPGDIIVLGRATPHGTGFRGIVYDAQPASPEEVSDFAVLIAGQGVPGSSGHVTTILVDSSWSAEGDCDQPGVGRAVWYHDELTNVWATMGSPNVVTRGMPFGRPLEGIYRFVGP